MNDILDFLEERTREHWKKYSDLNDLLKSYPKFLLCETLRSSTSETFNKYPKIYSIWHRSFDFNNVYSVVEIKMVFSQKKSTLLINLVNDNELTFERKLT